jgi:hypothetical protein
MKHYWSPIAGLMAQEYLELKSEMFSRLAESGTVAVAPPGPAPNITISVRMAADYWLQLIA